MKDTNISVELRERITDWLFILTMRLYGQNIYSEESYILKVYDSETVDEVDRFFENILNDFKYKHKDISRLKKLETKAEEILSR